MGLDLDDRAPALVAEAGAPEITLAMSDAGSLVLSRIKDDVAAGEFSIRDAVEQIYMAMHQTRELEASTGISQPRHRELLPASVRMASLPA